LEWDREALANKDLSYVTAARFENATLPTIVAPERSFCAARASALHVAQVKPITSDQLAKPAVRKVPEIALGCALSAARLRRIEGRPAARTVMRP
jgi:hypothetical protein